MKQIRKMRVLGRALLVATTMLAALSAQASGDSLVSEREGKVVIVDFWASWCVPCRRSFPWMNAMMEKYADDGLVIVAVNLDKDRDAAEAFLAEIPANFEIEFDPEASIAREYGVEAMPNSFVFGRDGELVARHLGFKVAKQDEYEAVLVQALGDTP
jgi:thiol-disulfide isomerase/thioredoxin